VPVATAPVPMSNRRRVTLFSSTALFYTGESHLVVTIAQKK